MEGGGVIISTRDYDKENIQGTVFKPYGIRYENGKNYIVSQIWEGNQNKYSVSIYIVEDDGINQPLAKVFRDVYYPIKGNTLLNLMEQAGFKDVVRITNEYFQPVFIGRR